MVPMIEAAADTEVDQLENALPINEEIRWFNIKMQHPLGMGCSKRGCGVMHKGHPRGQFWPAILHPFGD